MTTTIGMITAHMAARGRGEPASANGTRLTAEWQTGLEIMSGSPQGKLRLFFAPSSPQCEARQVDDPPKDRRRNVMFRSTSKRQQR